MKEAGYTAVEALVALAILGLTIGGLVSSMNVIGLTQSRGEQILSVTSAQFRASRSLETLLADAGPLRSDDARLTGDAGQLAFPCGEQVCKAILESGKLTLEFKSGRRTQVPLSSAGAPKFIYVGALSASNVWPPAQLPPPAPSWQVLRAIAISDGLEEDAEPIAFARAWQEQAPGCDFDVISQDCRP